MCFSTGILKSMKKTRDVHRMQKFNKETKTNLLTSETNTQHVMQSPVEKEYCQRSNVNCTGGESAGKRVPRTHWPAEPTCQAPGL